MTPTDLTPGLAGAVRLHAEVRPTASAVLAPGRAPLDYLGLDRRVAEIGRALNGFGIGRGHRVAIVLPNGPDLAVAFTGVAAHATAAPLNPAYREREFAFYLADMRADALLVPAGSDSPAVAVARSRGVRVLELVSDDSAPAGHFDLRGDPGDLDQARRGPAGDDDTALILHTSGTTSRPKLVPHTHAGLRTAAGNTRAWFAIGEHDLCLNMMPLFHAHGLTSTLIAVLLGGGGIVCAPGFSDTGFFDWYRDFRPTWYSAVPAMHQALVSAAAGHADLLAGGGLRFIRSASAPLSLALLGALEQTFGAPVIEAYGMTEAGSLVTANPLPPGLRKPGSVGVPVGEPVIILDRAGERVPTGESGEIAIRGGNVTAGYEDNPEANLAAFTADGWLRTGDEGRLDADGHLHIVGRSKEIINRGGMKVAPVEVDDALADHPAVKLAVAFGLPHPTLGEDVAVAVVAREGAVVVERDIRAHVAERLADHKVPSRVFRVDDVPRSPTGKVRRLALAEQIAERVAAEQGAPAAEIGDPVRRRIAGLWCRVLGRDRIGEDENFFDLGGNSLLLTRMRELLRVELGHDVPVVTLTMCPTVATLAEHLAGTDTAPVAAPRGRDRDRVLRGRRLRADAREDGRS
ncbi:non-ribosomal peptide synthetase [Actinokineospora pegani]|uniref:non-ribosomal peptide synthetase n=1 Tax=Actinokineospora pegani TaxID=2654637 RepID=UPI0012EA4B9B|nr:non-ribosomal peptide synthetase [Actinokineospora pegani]